MYEYDNEKESWKLLTNIEIYAIVEKPTVTATISDSLLFPT